MAISPADACAIAKEAYIYGFPLVDNYRIQYAYFQDRGDPEYKTPWNTLYNNARVYTPDDRAVVTPNSDTPYSYVGADLRAEPLVFTVPAIDKSRFYHLQFIDLYTFNFAYVGTRATGSDAGSFLLAGPAWNGEKPKGVKAVIRSETEFAFVLYRTQPLDPGDIENVTLIQAGYRAQPLSAFLGSAAPPPAPKIDFVKPLSVEEQRHSPEFFNLLSFVLQLCPTHPSETDLMAPFARLGIGAGKKVDVQSLSAETRKAIEAGIADAWQAFEGAAKDFQAGKFGSGDLFGTREHLNNNYLFRMTAVSGIYGNSQEEAVYTTYYVDTSSKQFVMRFPPGQLPQVNAFWSLTMYEMPASLLYANPLKRYLINSPMLPSLAKDPDGGLTLYVQHESPGEDKESNRLPAPNGPAKVALRLYSLKPEVQARTWRRPPLEEARQPVA
jgi:hypothetical protein